jgi:hypothetical protein
LYDGRRQDGHWLISVASTGHWLIFVASAGHWLIVVASAGHWLIWASSPPSSNPAVVYWDEINAAISSMGRIDRGVDDSKP